MEFGCRYIYVDDSRGDNNVQLESHLSPVPVSQNGAVLSPHLYDHFHPEEKPRNDAEVDGLQHCTVSPESNVLQDLQPISPAQLEDQKTSPPVPQRRKKSTVSAPPDPNQPHCRLPPEPNTHMGLRPKSPVQLHGQETPPPVPARRQMAAKTGVTEPETHAYEYATCEDSIPDGVTEPETHSYDYAICEDLNPNDLPQGVSMAPNDHSYLEVLPAVSTEMKMPTTSVNLRDHPMATSPVPPIERLPANCNILLLNIGKMVENSDTDIRASPLLCSGCSATCSKLNHVDDTKTWTCVFCAATNHLSDDSIFKSREEGDELYAADSQSGNEYSFVDQTMIIFCIDISGSMSVTTEVTQDQSNDYNIMYKTRMEAVKSALDQTLDFLHKQNSKKRVALVTFSDQVKIYGDGTIQPLVLHGAELLDPDHLKAQGEDQPMPDPLVNNLHALKEIIQCLKEKGATALGPAALVSIAMASKSPGSKVIICTDGRANTDLGNLEDISEEYVYQSSKFYYSNLGDLALQHSVVVSVVTIEGTNCRLPELGQLADKTGGKVNIVHPFKLANEFQSIMEEEIIATDVKLKVFLPKTMYFLYEGNNESVLERTFGSITADTVLSTVFDIHSSKIKEVLRYSQLPIQLHLTYTLPDGRSRWRILSQKRPVTNDGTTALESIDLNVLQIHSVQFSARLAMEGHVNEARTVALELKELIDLVMRHEKYEAHGVVYEEWENSMSPIYEDLQEFMKENLSKKTGQDSHMEIPVVKTFSDEMAKMIFNMKRAKKKVLSKLRN
ncbi:circularly permutated Ras protein 1-like isoform X2 [Bufo bufo]|uniref:circularly permutated Ras protein 1-like isoform X2 n=1 Tax=Bufo bufo TaxID=8384 RepID=UPI001ABE2EA4|nr:circularly permutated Ras protein 1-like isoform X2 [Bufo bufo]